MSEETEEASTGFIPEIRSHEGLCCFLTADRVCGPDCMAFVTNPTASQKSELSEQQQHCSLLVSAERVGRHLPIIASILNAACTTLEAREKRSKIEDADRRRNASTHGVPPNPFTGSR